MKVCILTLGCKVNAYESEQIKEQFLLAGHEETNDLSASDVTIINTCTVTNQADSKSRKMIRQARRENKDAIIVVCGCSAENHKDALMDLDIDILIGNKDKSKIVSLVEDFNEHHEKIVKFYDMRDSVFEDMKITNFKGRTRGFVKIQDGCNNFCSYCIIPFMRGSIRSKDIDIAESEINCLADNGYQEIVLTGIHTGSYGTGESYDLVDLIRRISKNDNLKRIRISSIEITELNDKFMEELKANNKICNHFHVPIQSGSNYILELMNRKYNIDEYKSIINKLRSIREDVNITTDLIVGFPEETDECFKETINNLSDIGFSKIHTFPYSIRKGTKASTMKQVNDSVKKERVKEVLELSSKLENKYYQKFIGKELTVLVEDRFSGFTDNYIKVHFDKECENNTFVNVVITDVDDTSVNGRVI
ncbi:MAG: tRNA (N(6)-L-threonylcarbamoyladenosine(37)-C(2))-methylthiotransferase MtaB [Erysipelotrichales bacterium]|nr:tRNA (N(6)-L-threonylcarbamoyladenosine(37)-C(2))-methylthiotransferase MtaB [Erysipelotrichales bacterium]